MSRSLARFSLAPSYGRANGVFSPVFALISQGEDPAMMIYQSFLMVKVNYIGFLRDQHESLQQNLVFAIDCIESFYTKSVNIISGYLVCKPLL